MKTNIDALLYVGQEVRLPERDRYKGVEKLYECRAFKKIEHGTVFLDIDDITIEEIKAMSMIQMKLWIELVDDVLEIAEDSLIDYSYSNPEKCREILDLCGERRDKLIKIYRYVRRVCPDYRLKNLENHLRLEYSKDFIKDKYYMDEMMHFSMDKILDYKNYVISQIEDRKATLDYAIEAMRENEFAYGKIIEDSFEILKDLVLHHNKVVKAINLKQKYYKK